MSSGPVWRAGAAAVPLRSWRDAQLGELARLLDAAWRSWAQEWEVADDPADAVVCRRASAHLAQSERWVGIGSRGVGRAWLQWSGDEGKHLAAAWFDEEAADTPVVREMVDAALQDLRHCLTQALRLAEGSGSARPAADRLAAWSGAVMADLPWGGLLLMEAAACEPLLAGSTRFAGPVLVGIGQAMAGADLRVRVHLQACELPIGALRSLRAGDVLRLAHRVDAPATVVDAQGQALFRAWLARSGGRRAVELAPLAAP